VRLAYEEMIRKQLAKAEAKRVEKEKKSMKSKIAEFRAEFIGNLNIAIASEEGEITKKLAEIENIRTKIGGFRERINATNLGMYDDEIFEKKLAENAPKKVVKKLKKVWTEEGRGRNNRWGKNDWSGMLRKDTLIRYGLLVNKEGGNCLYGKAVLRSGKEEKTLIYPTDKEGNRFDKDGNSLNWANKANNIARNWSTLSGFTRAVLIQFNAENRKKSSWDWADARGTTPFGEYYDENAEEWKPLATIQHGDKIN
jgi:hypothetical protein